MVAHAIGGSSLLNVKPDPRRSHNDMLAESVETFPSETAFDEKRRARLDPDNPTPTIVHLPFTGAFATALRTPRNANR